MARRNCELFDEIHVIMEYGRRKRLDRAIWVLIVVILTIVVEVS